MTNSCSSASACNGLATVLDAFADVVADRIVAKLNADTRNLPISRSQAQALTYSVDEAALVLGIGRSTIYRAIAAGSFPFPWVRVGNAVRIASAPIHSTLQA